MTVNLAGILANHARRKPNHPAVISQDGTLTYGDLDLQVRRIAGHLQGLGIGRGDVVGVCLRDSIDHLLSLYALAALGAIVLPLDWRWTGEEKSRIAQFFESRLNLHEEHDQVSQVIPGCAVDAAWHRHVALAKPIASVASGDSLPYLISLSSGTTGIPKGPLIDHAHLLSRFMIYIVSLGFSEQDVHLGVLPLYFGGGRGFAMCALYCGATVRLFPQPFDAAALVEEAERSQATVTMLVPTLIRRLLDLPATDRPVLGGMRAVASTGAVLHPDERLAALERVSPQLVNFYGSTEGGGLSLLRPADRGPAARSVGRPVFGTDVEIVDSFDSAVAGGEVGRIRYRGPGVAPGFHRNPDASAQSFKDGWFYPGDLGRLDRDGYLYLAGRAKDMIIRGGVNIYPEEIEQILCQLEAVTDAAVVGWPSAERGEEVAAYVVTREPCDPEMLREHCRSQLAPYKIPKAFFFIDALPRSSVGKVRKTELVARLPSGAD